ncbi:2TM domain-containing protein [Monashia sp. NPDC004114]
MDKETNVESVDATVDRTGAQGEDGLRAQAIETLKKKADFRVHLLVYALVNGMIVAIWMMTGSGFFWPIFPIAGWGVGLVMHAWDVFMTRPPTEIEVTREMDRLRDRT